MQTKGNILIVNLDEDQVDQYTPFETALYNFGTFVPSEIVKYRNGVYFIPDTVKHDIVHIVLLAQDFFKGKKLPLLIHSFRVTDKNDFSEALRFF